MNDNNKQFERLSFWQLLTKISIEIPIIQRDYAQGREIQLKIRDRFLKALHSALTDEPIELDFIYGSEENDTLQPLDGQQRLTTLFLLHWYIANKENKIVDFQNRFEIRDEKNEIKKSKFSYETRASSREFCSELTRNQIDLSNLLTNDLNENIELSKTIINSSWFVASWEKDPSISAMLIMLDAIHLKFKDTSELWDKMIDEQNPAIAFLYVKLENFGLSDDLYIKMNARGKQLTEFENFKSQFEKHIEINKFEVGNVKPEEKFAHKIDTIWTDLFWKYRGDDELIDNELINFIAGIAINSYAEHYTPTDRERIETRIADLANDANFVCPNDFTYNFYNYLVNCLNKYSEADIHKIKPNIVLWDYCKSTFFEDLISGEEVTYQKRVLFYGQTEYLLNNTFDQNTFDDWMRVIRNIVENSTINSASTFISAINLLKEISEGSGDIYNYFSKITSVKSGHASKQVKHEIEKAKLIIENPNSNKQVIFDTEDTNFCKGDIDFALFCIDYDNTKIATFDALKLKDLQEIFNTELNTENKITDDFKRAFLTIESNNYYDVWCGWSYSFNCIKGYLLDKNSDLIKYFSKSNNSKWREYLKKLLIQRMSKTFADIANNYRIPTNMPNWKEKLIKGKAPLEGATFILIHIENSYCMLSKQKKPSKKYQVTEITND